MNKGKVWLIGAGPGDPELLTVKGKKVLSQADVVIFDALVSESILGLIPESSKRIFAGKRSGNHYMKQSDTNRAILEEALKGKRVVRLKGGDPFVFGRGGEELELLVENDVPFEIVPGITSAFAAPAYSGIPVTHRDFCSSVHVITGHRRESHEYDIDFDALVRTGGTLIFLMGVASLPDIVKGLLDAGMAPDTPAAIVESGTRAAQRRISANLSDLEEKAIREGVKAPAVIIIGKVCSVADEFMWYEKLPLFGARIALTRPRELISEMAELLRSRGAEVIELPAIRTVSTVKDNEFNSVLDELQKGMYDWIVFTSPSGVRIFFDELIKRVDIRHLGQINIAAIGKGTEKALLGYGLKTDYMPEIFDGYNLGKGLREMIDSNSRILIPRASIGNPELVTELKKSGSEVRDYPIYDTEYILDDIKLDSFDFAVFTSASTVKAFMQGAGSHDLSKVRAVCIGSQTATQAEKTGMRTWVAEKATLESLADAVEKAVNDCR